jgi:ABC-type Mn2+/Zn2+ transport system ATPase subunit
MGPARAAAGPSRAGAPEGAALRTDGLEVRFGATIALSDVTLAIPAGARVALLGPNGAGKSTLLRAVLGLVERSAGTIEVGARSVAFVPQDMELEAGFPVTALDVVRIGRYGSIGLLRRFSASDHGLVGRAMDALDVTGLASRRFGDLSGGQRQRVLLAQAVAQDAELLLLDEPLTGVDAPTADRLRRLLDLWRTQGRTVIVATHDLRSASRDFDLVVCVNRRLVAAGDASTVLTDEILAETFAGQIFRLGDLVVEAAHHHHHDEGHAHGSEGG